MSIFTNTIGSAKRQVRQVVWVFLLCAGMCMPAGAARQARMIIDYPEYWPFFIRDGEQRMTGFFYDIVTEALGRMGIETSWREYPWGRCQVNVREGEAHAMITVPTKERLEYTVTHDTPFYQKKLHVFTYSGHPKLDQIRGIQEIDDIKELSLSVVTYTGNGWNDRNIRACGIKTYATPQLENVWQMLAHKRGDIAIEWSGAAWPDILRMKVEDIIVETDVSLESMPFHLLVGKDSLYADRMQEFDDVISVMRQDGTIDRMVGEYLDQPQPDHDLTCRECRTNAAELGKKPNCGRCPHWD